ncbi:MAG TPA: protein kinase [Kofleriaceae bacterium]|nr:protein kinase [Kofleriaceae bacterium]
MEALRERFGKYHVLEKIAQGGMAEVYKVKTVGIAGFEKIQALKRILPHQAREARFIRSFIDEARIAVELTHRNIVQVFDFGKADGELFLAMELIEGKDLRTAMSDAAAREALPDVAIAAYIISEVASGLDYAHRKADGYGGALGIVHCDVSPSNVMLSTEGDIKILDFGIARATFASALERRRLRGKPRYMAPEQTTGETPTAASDVFALGIIAWELFTGTALYRGSDLKAVLEAVRRTDPPRIDRINPQVPAEIAGAVATALSREPDARGSAADLANACARAAMPAGPRTLARWLKELETRPVRSPPPWHAEGTIAGVPDPSQAERFRSLVAARGGDPPGDRDDERDGSAAPSRPSATISLHDLPVPSGDSPGPRDRPAAAAAPPRPTGAPAPPAAHDDDARPVRVERTEPVERVELPGAFVPLDHTELVELIDAAELVLDLAASGRFEPDASTTQAARYDAGATHPMMSRFDAAATATAPQAFDPRRSARWQPEATVTGHARLADALPPETLADAGAGPGPGPGAGPGPGPGPGETTPFVRRSYERLELAPGVAPSALRFDDDATHHGFALPPGGPDDTSYDELDVEPEPPAPDAALAPAIGDAPIDDDLGEIAGGSLAERRRIVLVAGLLSGAPPDALRPVTKSLGELAYQRGGVVLELEPAALIVAFGLEIAGEDDVAIAMGWALDAAAMARDTGGDAGADGATVQVRIGARAGVATAAPSPAAPTVTVARVADTAPRIPADAIDDARALAREAAPDRPLFVGGAGRLTSSLYALRELSPGRRVSRRSRVIEVIGPRSFDERDRARLERRGTFVGRTVALAELDLWFQRAVAADRRLCVLITGAAGVGKSRLVAELVARRTGGAQGAGAPGAPGAPVRVITTASSPASRMAPFATVIDLYQAALGLPPARGRGARAQVVHRLYHLMMRAGLPEERARAVTTDLDRAMELRDGLGVAREVADLRPRISAGLATFRTIMTSRERPALTIVEDVHLADSASLEVMRHTLAMPAAGPELLVLTTRPEGPPPPAVDAAIALDDLAGPDLRALIVDRLGDAASPMAIATVLARSGGNPLFVEELAQAVRDAGAGGEDVPASARDVVSARVDRLPVKAKTALRYASVLGGTVRARLLEELLGEDSLEHELDEVVSAGFLVRPDGAVGSAEGELAFARGLVREVVYESLSARAQRDTHARVGRLLASRFFAGREEPPAAIAEHLERGGELAGAAAFWLRAGRLALAASDAGAAIACFTRTLALERELGAAPPTAAAKARRREALAGREEARRLQGDLAADPGDLDELERLCDGEPARLADVAIRRAQRMLRLGDYARATEATVAAEHRATEAGDDRLRGEALRVRAEILERIGRFDEALAVVGAARELFHRQRLVAEEMAAMVGRGRIHLLRADYEAARDAYRPVLVRIDKTGDPWLERIVSNHVAVIEMCLGNFAAAMRCAQRSLELCRRYGDRGREGDALSVAAIVLLEVGLYDQAAAMFADALDVLARTNSRWSRADCLIYTGICEQRRGRTGGLRLIDEALDEARRLGARYLEANALVARAAVHLRTGALGAAIADAAAGTAVARDATLVGYEIQGLARHALALARLGNHTAEAAALAHRALGLLDAQRHLEGSVEEVIAACAGVLQAAGAHDHAAALRERGRASARSKLAALPDPTWRAAYAAVPEIAELLG